MAISGLNVAVVGGGIGGLATALALRARGATVTVFEQAPELTEVGAGLQITPNGFAVLSALGLGDALVARSVAARAVALLDYRYGRPVVRLDLTRFQADSAYLFVHRADLIDLLAQAVRDREIALRLDAAVTRFGPGAQPQVFLGDAAERFDLVVGAEGLHSTLRGQLNGPSAPYFTHQVAWRAVVPNAIKHPPHARVTMGPGRHLVSYPLRGGDLVNIVAVQERREWAAEGWSHTDDPDALRAAFSDFGPQSHALLDLVGDVGLWGLFRHPVARRWHGEGVVLVGDAAHPTLPFLAQGANLALEDAWVLADDLDKHGVVAGLPAYQSRRRSRVERVIDAATRNAWKYHLAFPPLRVAAHTVMRIMGALVPGRMTRSYDWVYRADVTKD